MKKKIYAIYSKSDKDSSVFSSINDQETIDIALQVIFDSEEYDDFFDDDGKFKKKSNNVEFFYDMLKDYSLYCIAEFDSSTLRLDVSPEAKNIDIKALLEAMNKAVII